MTNKPKNKTDNKQNKHTHAHTDRKQHQQNKTKSKNAMWYLESVVAMKLSWKYILLICKKLHSQRAHVHKISAIAFRHCFQRFCGRPRAPTLTWRPVRISPIPQYAVVMSHIL